MWDFVDFKEPEFAARGTMNSTAFVRQSAVAARLFVLFAVGLLAPLVAGLGCNAPDSGGPPKAKPPLVSIIETRRGPFSIEVERNATTSALESVIIRARVRGELQKVSFTEGSDVKKNDPLFMIEKDIYQSELDAANAKVAEAAAALDKAQQSKSREVAQAQLKVSQATNNLAKVEEARQRALLARRAASQDDYDRAAANQLRTAAEVESDEATQAQALVDYGINIETAKANLAAAKAEVEKASINLGYCDITSPITGRIGSVKIKQGNIVGALSGSPETELTSIQQLDPLGIDIQVSSRYLETVTRRVAQGLTMTVRRPGFEGEDVRVHPYPAKAIFLDNQVDPTTSTFLLRASVANPEKTLLPGDYVSLQIQLEERQDAISIPEQAVIERQQGQIVFTVDDQNQIKAVPVKSRFTSRGMRLIEEGLSEGAKVVVEGIQFARQGLTVETKPYTPPPTKRETSGDNVEIKANGEVKGESKAPTPMPTPTPTPTPAAAPAATPASEPTTAPAKKAAAPVVESPAPAADASPAPKAENAPSKVQEPPKP